MFPVDDHRYWVLGRMGLDATWTLPLLTTVLGRLNDMIEYNILSRLPGRTAEDFLYRLIHLVVPKITTVDKSMTYRRVNKYTLRLRRANRNSVTLSEEDWIRVRDAHVNENEHHPEFWFGRNECMTASASRELLFDLYVSAMPRCANGAEAYLMAIGWMFEIKDGFWRLNKKFRQVHILEILKQLAFFCEEGFPCVYPKGREALKNRLQWKLKQGEVSTISKLLYAARTDPNYAHVCKSLCGHPTLISYKKEVEFHKCYMARYGYKHHDDDKLDVERFLVYAWWWCSKKDESGSNLADKSAQ